VVREAIGDRAAILDGRIDVTRREDAVLVLAEVLREGFRSLREREPRTN
jgi:hypothetical protein